MRVIIESMNMDEEQRWINDSDTTFFIFEDYIRMKMPDGTFKQWNTEDLHAMTMMAISRKEIIGKFRVKI